MKKISILPLTILLLAGCSYSKGYDFSYIALDAVLNEVSYDDSIVINNALYHAFDEESNLNELGVMYYSYDDKEYGEMDSYLMFEYDEKEVKYVLTFGDEAEKYFYFATGMDHDSYISLKAKKLNKYLLEK